MHRFPSSFAGRTILLWAAWGLAACSGSIGASGGDDGSGNASRAGGSGSPSGGAGSPGGGPTRPPEATSSDACRDGTIDPGPTVVRRLNHDEYDNTVRDLLGDTSRPAKDFPAIEKPHGFDTDAQALTVSPVLAEGYLTAAETLAATAVDQNLAKIFTCDTTKTGEDACAKTFVEQFGARAYRRPLDDADRAQLQGAYADGKTRGGYKAGLKLVIETALMSPRFMYRVEFGQPPKSGESLVALDDYEMASRLSYFLWSSMPDATLFDAAKAGKLRDRNELRAQVTRMLGDAKARATTARFHALWLDLARLDRAEKDVKIYKDWQPSLVPLMHDEAARFTDAVVWDGEGDLATLLTAPYSYVDKTLATFYGVSAPSGTGVGKVSFSDGKHAGLLTLGGVLSAYSKPDQTDPVHRGKFVREALLCDDMPPPPPGLMLKPPELDPNLTTRERFTRHQDDPSCVGCHKLMDPLGLGFESFDGTGRFRANENGKTIDSTGKIVSADGSSDDVTFDGAVDLAKKLSTSDKVRACVVTKWFRFAVGRLEREASGGQTNDACSLDVARKRFEAGKYSIRELVAALTETDAFLFRRAVAPGGDQ